MGVFDWLRRTRRTHEEHGTATTTATFTCADSAANQPPGSQAAVQHDIDVSRNGIAVDGALLPDLTVSTWSAALGEPRVVPPTTTMPDERGSAPNTLIVWDAAGVWGYTNDLHTLTEVCVRLTEDEGWDARVSFDPHISRPRCVFSGRFTLSGVPAMQAVPEQTLRQAYILLKVKTGEYESTFMLTTEANQPLADMEFSKRLQAIDDGSIAEHLRAQANPLREVSISHHPVRASSGRWKHAPHSGPQLEISQPAFRYAIIQNLMYDQEAIQPRFDVYDFAADQGASSFDPDDYGSEVIPSVKTWFRRLPLPAELGARVETLTLDGGNEIYLQLAPQWDGEDGRFRIRSLSAEELSQFPNLRSVVDIGGFLSPAARRVLEDAGISVGD